MQAHVRTRAHCIEWVELNLFVTNNEKKMLLCILGVTILERGKDNLQCKINEI